MDKKPSRPFKLNMVMTSIAIVLLGALFLVVSEWQGSAKPWWGLVRDFGIALCSTGFISVAYEFLIRDQLLQDHMTSIKTALNPDGERLGILRIFSNRTERAEAGFAMDDLIQGAQSELFIFSAVPIQTLVERRKMIAELIQRGASVKLLIFDPSSTNLHALDETLACTPGALVEDLRNVRDAIATLRSSLRSFGAEGRLDVRCNGGVPPFKIVASDPDSETGRFLVELNGFNLPDDDHASFLLRRQDGGLYHRYRRQLDTLWDASRPFDEAHTVLAHLNEPGIAVGWQDELYDCALKLCAERGVRHAVFYQYSASTLQAMVRGMLRNGWDIQLVLEAPEVAEAINAVAQRTRISGMIDTFRCYDDDLKSHLKIRQSHVPNTVRAAMFGDDLIVLGWYYYLAVSTNGHNGKMPNVEVNGDGTFGVLVERSNPAFEKVRTFLGSYEAALHADAVGL